MRVELLGPVRVTFDDSVSVEVRGAKDRALLSLLALNAGRFVPAERLLDELWGEDLPGNSTNALQARVSHLRHLLGAEKVAHRGGGYVLEIDPTDVDILQFDVLLRSVQDALRTGEYADALPQMEAALFMWHGQPLEGIDLTFARSEAMRLAEARLNLLEDYADARLELGQDAQLVGELAQLHAEHPLRERPLRLLMLALYRSGRQAEALAVYQNGKEVLASELGLDPSQELRELERAVLNQDPALEGPPEPIVRRGNLPAPIST